MMMLSERYQDAMMMLSGRYQDAMDGIWPLSAYYPPAKRNGANKHAVPYPLRLGFEKSEAPHVAPQAKNCLRLSQQKRFYGALSNMRCSTP